MGDPFAHLLACADVLGKGGLGDEKAEDFAAAVQELKESEDKPLLPQGDKSKSRYEYDGCRDTWARSTFVSAREVQDFFIAHTSPESLRTLNYRLDTELLRKDDMIRHATSSLSNCFRRAMLLDKFRGAAQHMMRGTRRKSYSLDPFARFMMGQVASKTKSRRRSSPIKEEVAAPPKILAKSTTRTSIFQYAVKCTIIDRKMANPNGDPWDAFFYNIYKAEKPQRRNTGTKMIVRKNVKEAHSRKGSLVTPTEPPAIVATEVVDVLDTVSLKEPEPEAISLKEAERESAPSRLQSPGENSLLSLCPPIATEWQTMAVQASTLAKTSSPSLPAIRKEGRQERTPVKREMRPQQPIRLPRQPAHERMEIHPVKPTSIVATGPTQQTAAPAPSTTLPVVAPRRHQQGQSRRARSEMPRFRFGRITHSPDGKTALTRLFYLPLIPQQDAHFSSKEIRNIVQGLVS